MEKNQEVTVNKEREVRTYADMWHTSYCLLQNGQEQIEGSYHQFLASLVFTAFTLEAYLNHIGPKVFRCWKDLERLGPKEKLNVISEKLGIEIDYSRRPWQVLKQLFGFRNDIAHGKTVTIFKEETVKIQDYNDPKLRTFAETTWEKYCTEKNAVRAREDVENIVKTIHEATKLEDEYPFVSGMQFSKASFF